MRGANVPPAIETDEQRLQQVIKNLLSNAFKFTESGGVKLRIGVAEGRQFASEALSRAEAVLEFTVEDTGVGIAARQAPPDLRGLPAGGRDDEPRATAEPASGSRSAARSHACSAARSTWRARLAEAARSRSSCRPPSGPSSIPTSAPPSEEAVVFPGEGTAAAQPASAAEPPELDPARLLPSDVRDDRDDIQDGDRVVLIVEDDPDLARTELEVARDRGFKGIVAHSGRLGPCARARVQARRDHPRHEAAGDGRLDRARSPEAPSGDASHSGAHRLCGRRAPERAQGRRGRIPREADLEGGPREHLRRNPQLHRPRPQAAARGRGRRVAAAGRRRADRRATRTSR